jgi:hypothetical protein
MRSDPAMGTRYWSSASTVLDGRSPNWFPSWKRVGRWRYPLWLDQRALDTARSNGLPLFGVTEMMAYHLRQTRRDRILRGQAAVRGNVRFGRPPIAKTRVEKARIALAAGKGVREAARHAGISAAWASRLKTALGAVSTWCVAAAVGQMNPATLIGIDPWLATQPIAPASSPDEFATGHPSLSLE